MDKKYDFYPGKGMEKQGSDNGLAKYVDFDKGEFKMQCKSSEGTQIIILKGTLIFFGIDWMFLSKERKPL